jgi:hypothetical protein
LVVIFRRGCGDPPNFSGCFKLQNFHDKNWEHIEANF